MSIEFNLYSSDGCHLCEQALEICSAILPKASLQVVDIVEDDELVKRYGVHIPVLARIEDNKQLFWPFTSQQVKELI